MKQIHFVLSISLLCAVLPARSQSLVWGQHISDQFTGHLYVRDNLTDWHGNTYVAGQFGGSIDFDPGPGAYSLVSPDNHSAFIAKYDSSGQILWARAMISDTILTIGSGINAITLDKAGNVYAVGYFYATTDFDPGSGTHTLVAALGPDMFVEKLDSSGNFSWVVQFEGTHSVTSRDIVFGPTGDLYLTGRFGGTADFDPSPAIHNMTAASGGLDVFLLKITTGGSLLWAVQVPGQSSDDGISIAASEQGDVYLAGSFTGTADFDPGPATYHLSSGGYKDFFIAKFNLQGNLVWAKSFGAASNDEASAIVCDRAGNTYTTGGFGHTVDFDPGPASQTLTSGGNFDAFLLKLDSSGAYRWVKRIGGTYGDYGMAVTLSDAAINLAIAFTDSIDVDPGAGILYMGVPLKQQFGYLHLDTAGDLNWAIEQEHAISTPGACYMGEDLWGYTYLTGRFYGTIDCDPGPSAYYLSAATSQPAHFIIKLKPAATTVEGTAVPEKNYRVYPNPGKGTINISAAETIDRIVVSDMTGKVVCHQRPAGRNVSVAIGEPGIYLLSIVFDQYVATEKIVVRQ
jgi:hypothetical protein